MFRLSRPIALTRSNLRRSYADLNRPGPFPLPKKDQDEFEALQRKASEDSEASTLHPDAFARYEEFTGDKNPVTGEIGGPKQDPLRHGDYSFDGRVTDF